MSAKKITDIIDPEMEDHQNGERRCFPPIKYNQRSEKERQQFDDEIIDTLYPFLKEFITFH